MGSRSFFSKLRACSIVPYCQFIPVVSNTKASHFTFQLNFGKYDVLSLACCFNHLFEGQNCVLCRHFTDMTI